MKRAAFFSVLVLLCLTGVARPAPPAKVEKPSLAQHVKSRVATTLDGLQADGDFAKASEDLTQLFDQVIACAPVKEKDLDAWRDVAYALRLVNQLEQAPAASRLDLLKYLRANDNLARSLTMLVGRKERPIDVYRMLDRLRQERGEQLDKFANLAAALCVVHDRPFERRINENQAKAPDPVALFDYYVRNERLMNFGVRPVPAELLIYVVDTTASVEEMTWALQKHAGNAKVGNLFFTIKYDYEHFRRGTAKKVTVAGFNLPNILQHGGVCADQAYYAMSVGKAIGVPTAYAVGASGDVGHAWVGYLQAQGRSGWWNFDEGRYEAYRGVRGIVRDPQLREAVPDAYVSLLAELIGTKPENRQAATALTDAVARLTELEKDGKALEPAPLDEAIASTLAPVPVNRNAPAPKPAQRKADVATQLELLEIAVKQSPGDRHCWFAVRDLAEAGKLSLAQKRYWSDLLQRQCGTKYPDFTLALLTPMVKTIEDPKEQNKLWNAAFTMFAGRSDLAASVRMAQAEMWEKHEQPDSAGQCYMDVIERFANAGPFVLEALAKAEETLVRTNRADRVPVLYQQTWSKIQQPKDMAGPFATQSNWFRVGSRYAKKLEEAGNTQQAAAVVSQLETRVGARLR